MMNSRGHNQSHANHSLSIRQEIHRFESVHPSIYAIYDLIEEIPDPLIQQQIREYVVCIEDSFVNSQEWTLSGAVPDLKLGVLGSVHSGKSALVHRYLTGSYLPEESPEGGRFKKEVMLDGQSYLLLMRDEGGPPEMQFTHWVDAVIFVFSLENELSFNAIYSYYAKMAHYRNTAEIPLILVGTQDAISESNPRVIDDTRARKLASDLKRCTYYETCATYGLNVERVFQDACQKIVQSRVSSGVPGAVGCSRPSTPNHSTLRSYYSATANPTPPQLPQAGVTAGTPKPYDQSTLSTCGSGGGKSYDTHSTSSQSTSGSGNIPTVTPNSSSYNIQSHSPPFRDTLRSKEQKMKQKSRDRAAALTQPSLTQPSHPDAHSPRTAELSQHGFQPAHTPHGGAIPVAVPTVPSIPPPPAAPVPDPPPPRTGSALAAATALASEQHFTSQEDSIDPASISTASGSTADVTGHDLPTPTSTPTQTRKNRRRSNIFTQKKGDEEKRIQNGGQMGSGRVIPLKQGYLYKKSSKPLSKEWKKKYVTLLDDGRLMYHPSLHDYMDDVHAKEILLVRTTVKIPGMKPKGSRSSAPTPNTNGDVKHMGTGSFNMAAAMTPGNRLGMIGSLDDDASTVIPNASLGPGGAGGGMIIGTPNSKIETPNVKKRHRRAKSGTKNLDAMQNDDLDGYEFIIVSLDNKHWNFEASSFEEREEWVTAIEQQILSSLQACESTKKSSSLSREVSGHNNNRTTDPMAIAAIRAAKGNGVCVDCEASKPDWASLNLGALICIECSGIHRNLGTHLSRVRSLDLDEWPTELVAVMVSVGNQQANSVWEANTCGRTKPTKDSSREVKSKWIRSKYEGKEFIPPIPYVDVPISQQLIDSVARQDVRDTIIVLAHANVDDVNTPYSATDRRTALHITAALGNSVLMQFLLWNQADCNAVDHEGKKPLYYAKEAGASECVHLLRMQTGSQDDEEADDDKPSSIHPSSLERLA